MPLNALLVPCSWLHPSTPLTTILSWGRGVPHLSVRAFSPSLLLPLVTGLEESSCLHRDSQLPFPLCCMCALALCLQAGMGFPSSCIAPSIVRTSFFSFGCARSSLQCVDPPVGAHDLSCLTACGILVPRWEIKPTSYKAHLLCWKVNSQPLGPQRSPSN